MSRENEARVERERAERVAALNAEFSREGSYMMLATYSARLEALDAEAREALRSARLQDDEDFNRRANRVFGASGVSSREHPLFVAAMKTIATPGFFDHSNSRIIEGIASTPALNSHGYAVESNGVQCELPIPLLVHHDWNQVVGKVILCTSSASEVSFRAKVANTLLADEVWEQICSGELAAVSAAQHWLEDRDEKLYRAWAWSELSVARSGACPGARILLAKNIGLARQPPALRQLTAGGASGSSGGARPALIS